MGIAGLIVVVEVVRQRNEARIRLSRSIDRYLAEEESRGSRGDPFWG
jgi:hypothetical protein